MLQSVRCIKFGEVLFDENLRTILLCTNCHMDYKTLDEFRQHFDYCASSGQSTQGLCSGNGSLVLPRTKDGSQSQHLLGRYCSESKEFLVYKFNGLKRQDVRKTTVPNNHDDDFMDLIKIEEELLDPRWYTEINDSQVDEQATSYNDLVEAVTPFVQFKENLKTNECKQKSKISNAFATSKSNKNKNDYETYEIDPNSLSPLKTYGTKRRISCQKQSSIDEVSNAIKVCRLPVQSAGTGKPTLDVVNGHGKQKLPIQKSQRMKLLTTTTTTPMDTGTESGINGNIRVTKTELTPPTRPHVKPVPTELLCRRSTDGTTTNDISTPTKSLRTQQILNKLQTLGLQVKRKHTVDQEKPPLNRNPEKEKAMELVKKLQSKGMNVKIIQTNSVSASKLSSPELIKKPRRECISSNVSYEQLTKTSQLNRNLTIKKVK